MRIGVLDGPRPRDRGRRVARSARRSRSTRSAITSASDACRSPPPLLELHGKGSTSTASKAPRPRCHGYEKDKKTLSQGGYSNVIVVDENYGCAFRTACRSTRRRRFFAPGITLYPPLAHWKAGPGKKVVSRPRGASATWVGRSPGALGADVRCSSHSDRA